MMPRRNIWARSALGVLVTLALAGVSRNLALSAEDPKPPEAAAPAEAAKPAEAPAAPAAAPDATVAPTKADSTGAYTDAAMYTLSGDKDKDGKIVPTLESLAKDAKLLKVSLNVVWVLLCGFLIMFMQAGFALVETGLTRGKNVGHTMAMNFVVYAVGMLGYWVCGFALQMGGLGPILAFDGPNVLDKMYKISLFGKDFGIFGYKGFFLTGDANDMSVLVMFLFQMVFMDTAATIPTGALAERWKFSSFMVFSFFLGMFLYPIYGCWVWGGGWLANLGVNFGIGNGHIDFAGCSVVHMTGGVCALAGALVVGPRIGKFNKDGSANAIPGHNIPMIVLGTLILAFGWFGFNSGSTLAATDGRVASVAVCTMLATAAGTLSSILYMWAVYGKPDPTMGCNGLLAGAVAITAPCAFVNPVAAVLIGAIAGILVIWSVLFVEKVLKVDDPVGAVSVHGVCGAFGCLCIGLFANGEYGKGWNATNLSDGTAKPVLGLFYGGGTSQLLAEAIGVAANILWVFPLAFACFFIIEKTMGNRVRAADEIGGLDIPEMGVVGYVDEDPIQIRNIGEEHLDTHGPGVPTKLLKNGAPKKSGGVPTARS